MSRPTVDIQRAFRPLNDGDEHSKSEGSPSRSARPMPVSFSPQYSTLDFASSVLKARNAFMKRFPRHVFRDTAWDIVLELFIAGEQRRVVCIKEVMLASRESPAGIGRRLDTLETAGMIERYDDPADHRRILLRLTDEGKSAVSTLLRSMFVGFGDDIGRICPAGAVSTR